MGLLFVGLALSSCLISTFFVHWNEVLAQVQAERAAWRAWVDEHLLLATLGYFALYFVFTALAFRGRGDWTIVVEFLTVTAEWISFQAQYSQYNVALHKCSHLSSRAALGRGSALASSSVEESPDSLSASWAARI